MLVIYVGDSTNVVNRIRHNHCSGNVEGSALRRSVAESIGYQIKHTIRPSGSKKLRIDLPNPGEGEARVSRYIRSGKWKYVLCRSHSEARNFQLYAIEHLQPILNKDLKAWDQRKEARFAELLRLLQHADPLPCARFKDRRSGPGVYVLLHTNRPST